MVAERSVGAVVVNPTGLYLLLNRADKNGDFWEFPKGHQAEGERDIVFLVSVHGWSSVDITLL